MRHQGDRDPASRRETNATPQGNTPRRTSSVPQPGQISPGVHVMGTFRRGPRGPSRRTRIVLAKVAGPRKGNCSSWPRADQGPTKRLRTTPPNVLSQINS